VYLLLTSGEVEKVIAIYISSCKRLNNKKTLLAFINLQAKNVAIAIARERKRQQIVCALLTAWAVSGGRKSADIYCLFLPRVVVIATLLDLWMLVRLAYYDTTCLLLLLCYLMKYMYVLFHSQSLSYCATAFLDTLCAIV